MASKGLGRETMVRAVCRIMFLATNVEEFQLHVFTTSRYGKRHTMQIYFVFPNMNSVKG